MIVVILGGFGEGKGGRYLYAYFIIQKNPKEMKLGL